MSNIPDEVKRIVLERDDYQCLNCGREDYLEPAHYKAKSQLGTDNVDNIMTLCSECHRKQHDGKLQIIKIGLKFFFKENL